VSAAFSTTSAEASSGAEPESLGEAPGLDISFEFDNEDDACQSICSNGLCYNGECECDYGWEGQDCDQAVCGELFVCHNGGSCQNGLCTCANGWNGERCEGCGELWGLGCALPRALNISIAAVAAAGFLGLAAHQMKKHRNIDKYVVAVRDFQGVSRDGEISFKKGDYVKLVSKGQSEWWTGEINGITGTFPSNCVGDMPKRQHRGPQKPKVTPPGLCTLISLLTEYFVLKYPY
jgi:hypothetical protein